MNYGTRFSVLLPLKGPAGVEAIKALYRNIDGDPDPNSDYVYPGFEIEYAETAVGVDMSYGMILYSDEDGDIDNLKNFLLLQDVRDHIATDTFSVRWACTSSRNTPDSNGGGAFVMDVEKGTITTLDIHDWIRGRLMISETPVYAQVFDLLLSALGNFLDTQPEKRIPGIDYIMLTLPGEMEKVAQNQDSAEARVAFLSVMEILKMDDVNPTVIDAIRQSVRDPEPLILFVRTMKEVYELAKVADFHAIVDLLVSYIDPLGHATEHDMGDERILN